ncbi:efflux RND transporter periplasmic adaptor subunit [Allosphingosinicella indica]|uniref:Membrane fusion protein, multidrug efflux system n=1 Tax=Allosphingosinicella indica TaxID=941907 RepID=A0A1X7GQ11_9SPHN|nr:efflux RND transporter periplasmic adaptor subunit [Allosphingosinicella indica]SMF72885.1 membrane fusion protein, multidrug efflux system [Allosphingosinicella indica]
MRLFWKLNGAAAAAALLAGCAQEAPPAPPPPEVEVFVVRTQTVPNEVVLPGRIQAIRTAEVRARVDGIVQRRLYDEGSDVRAGQALFQIDPRELRAALSGAQAALSRAQATAANAQQDVNRYKPLLADQAVSRQENDAAVARLRTANADVAQNRAQVEAARLNLSYATVTAPISGRASRAEVTEGALVSAGSGTLLTRIEQIDRIYVNFGQSSSDLLQIRRDAASGKLNLPNINNVEVKLELEDGSTYGVVGRIDFLDLAIDPETGTAALRAEFPNPGQLLLPGQFVRAHIFLGTRPDGILVPQRAVKVAAQGASVMVVGEKNVVAARPVQLGPLMGGNWVVRSGLKPGDRIIVNGLQKAMPGQPVSIAKPGASPAPAGGQPAAQPAPKG